MASLLLTSIAQAATSGLSGVSGALIQAGATAAAGFAGDYIDKRLFGGGSSTAFVQGARLNSLEVMVSREGGGIPWVDGRVKVAGNVIWATRLEEVASTTVESTGGGGKGGGGASQRVETTEFLYFASFAVALADCRGGPVQSFGRIWADGRPFDPLAHTVRFYHGTETQNPDPLIEAKDIETPAYRGVAYIVFDRLALAEYGNRLPQIQVELFCGGGEMESLIKGVDLIPGSTEFGYSPQVVRQVSRGQGGGITEERPENANRFGTVSDWTLSLDMLQGVLPEVVTAALVVAWFGDDLRAGQCKIAPRVEIAEKDTAPIVWSAGGLSRAIARPVSLVEGRPAFGSTPADASVVAALKDLAARGIRSVLYPFILLDIPADAALPDPSGVGMQGAFPWRGRIAPTAGADLAAEVAAFAGLATAADFAVSGDRVIYSGPADDWGFRRYILHLAHLGKAAGGVGAFLIGSEMVALTTATTPGSGVYPFVDLLRDLAAEVSAVLPDALISYAADWSEYHSHRPADGSGDVFFNLDPLWADPAVDFVAIDNYFPLSDWRPGSDHLDYRPDLGWTSPYSLPYLKANIEGGEYFDFFYATPGDRAAQIRTPIADSAHAEDWVFRQKAVRDWHGNPHRNRPGGVRDATPTAWVPGSKPVWFSEIGCPAVDLGANQPNVFFSPKSSESQFPYFSNGTRDDFAQRQFLRAALEWWRDFGGGVLDIGNALVWSWDARPWPEFPTQTGIWSDGGDWRLGHWLNGRAGAAPTAEAIRRRLVVAHGWPAGDLDLSDCHGQADGYALPAPVGFRAYVQPWEVAARIDAAEAGGVLSFRSRAAALPVAAIGVEDMVDPGEGGASRFSATRAAAEDVVRSSVFAFSDGDRDYQAAAARASIEVGPETGDGTAESPLVLDIDRATAAAEMILRAAAEGRERITFSLPLSRLAVRPGRLITVTIGGDDPRVYIVDSVAEGAALTVAASSYSAGAFAATGGVGRIFPARIRPPSAAILAAFLDLPLLIDQGADDWPGFVAAHAAPWPGGADFHRSPDPETGFRLNTRVGRPATMGETVEPLAPGRLWVWSGERLVVRLFSGGLVSRPEADVLDGANALALVHPGGVEVVQFRDAELIGPRTWALTRLLRGQRGTDGARAAAPLAPGARVVVLDSAVVPVAMIPGDIGRAYFWRYGPAAEDPAAAGFQTESVAFQGIGRRPFSPAQLRAAPTSGGDVLATWTRRTRVEGDAWPELAADVPLAEVSESYLVEIGPALAAGGAPVRTATTSAPGFTYAAAMRAADALVAPGPYQIRVRQVSESFGPGAPAFAEIP